LKLQTNKIRARNIQQGFNLRLSTIHQDRLFNVLSTAYTESRLLSRHNSSMFDRTKLIELLSSSPRVVEELFRTVSKTISICTYEEVQEVVEDLVADFPVSEAEPTPNIQEAIDELVTDFQGKCQTNIPPHAECESYLAAFNSTEHPFRM